MWLRACERHRAANSRFAGGEIGAATGNQQAAQLRRGAARPQPLQLPSRPPTHPPCSTTSSFYTFFFFSFFPCSFSSGDSSRHLVRRREVSGCEAPSASHQKMVSQNKLSKDCLQFSKSVNVALRFIEFATAFVNVRSPSGK